MKYRFQFDSTVPFNDQLRSPEVAFRGFRNVTWTDPKRGRVEINGRNNPQAEIVAAIYLYFAPGRLL